MKRVLLVILLFSSALISVFGSDDLAGLDGKESAGLQRLNTVTLEYLFGIAGLALDGAGVGFGYERVHLPWLASRYSFSFGVSGAGNSQGTISLVSAAVGVLFYPLGKAPSGLIIRANTELLYMGTVGEELYGGLESHALIPMLTFGCGWRFDIGKKRVSFSIQPELSYTFFFPGYTSSGLSGNLESGTTGIWAGMLHPSLILGVGF